MGPSNPLPSGAAHLPNDYQPEELDWGPPAGKTSRDIPFHVPMPDESSLTGYVMVEQIKSVDCASRNVKFVERAPASVLDEVLSILDACLYSSQ